MAGDSALTVQSASLNGSLVFSTNDTAGYMKDILSSTGALTIDISDIDVSKLILLVDRPGDTKNPTIVVEDGAYLSGGAIGNLTKLTTAAGEYILGPFESARFMDSSEKINITKSTTDTTIVYVRAVLLP